MKMQSNNDELKNQIRTFTNQNEIDSLVAEQLGWYVYGIYRPGSKLPFYIGKGKGTRVLQHFDQAIRLETNVAKLSEIRSIFIDGETPVIKIIRRDIESEDRAYEVEASLIDAIQPQGNQVLGHGATEIGIADLKNLIAEYAAIPLEEFEILDPLLLIKVDRLWNEYDLSRDLDAHILYEITRGFWKVSLKRVSGRLVCAVVGGIIREIYVPKEWHPAIEADGSRSALNPEGRYQFSGTAAVSSQHRSYVHRSVKHLYKPGAQSPVTYWPK